MTFDGCTQERAEGFRRPRPSRPPEAAAAAVVGEEVLAGVELAPSPPSTHFEVGISKTVYNALKYNYSVSPLNNIISS